MSQRKVGWVFGCIVWTGFWAGAAWADPFVGTWSVDSYADLNISDGIADPMAHEQATVTGTRVDADHVQWASSSHATVTLFQDGDTLALASSPLDTGTGLWPAYYVMSDGVNGASVLIGQEYSDPADISVTASLWSGSDSAVAAADVAGLWSIDLIEHLNLRHLADTPPEAFERNTILVELTDLGGSLLQVDVVGVGTLGVVELSGNRLHMVSTNDEADYHLFEIATDGATFSFALVASETDDPTDVGVSIGLGRPVPEPGALSLLTLGALAPLRRRSA